MVLQKVLRSCEAEVLTRAGGPGQGLQAFDGCSFGPGLVPYPIPFVGLECYGTKILCLEIQQMFLIAFQFSSKLATYPDNLKQPPLIETPVFKPLNLFCCFMQ